MQLETLFSLPKDEVERAQREALVHRFESLRPQLAALDALATRQGVDKVEDVMDAVPVFFDHRVFKSYPFSLVEQRKFDRLTAWLQRLTTHQIASLPMDGVRTVEGWLDRLNDETPLSVGHTTGTSGKLSFLPRSESEWPAWRNCFYEAGRAASGNDRRKEVIPSFQAGYRREHYWVGKKLNRWTREAAAGGGANQHFAFDYDLSPDLLSMAARLQQAEERGELDKLDIDPSILEERALLVERNRHREEDLQRWFLTLVNDYRGQKVSIGGTTGDLVAFVRRGQAMGIVCDFAPGSTIGSGGGLKGLKDPPEDPEAYLKEFFGIDRMSMTYGFAENMGQAPRCDKGFYHFFPYTVPVVLDEDFAALPREGVQTGRMCLFDLLAESYWGGFISGDRVTVYWDHDCDCGWTGPRIDGNIKRFSELEGVADDKISCAGSAEAYSGFMDYVGEI
jgi:hypothetical protein